MNIDIYSGRSPKTHINDKYSSLVYALLRIKAKILGITNSEWIKSQCLSFISCLTMFVIMLPAQYDLALNMLDIHILDPIPVQKIQKSLTF